MGGTGYCISNGVVEWSLLVFMVVKRASKLMTEANNIVAA